ncbi:MAG TPA: sensor histidine kinase, partial [Panacibacter sp.]|nr:sensor histidine kinase [Panacibacter sp.]
RKTDQHMKKSFIVLWHIGFWVCYFTLIGIMLGVYYRSIIHANNQEDRILNALKSLLLFAFIPSFISYWAYYLFLFPKYLQHKRVFLAIIHGVAISVTAAIIGYILIRYEIESGNMVDMDDAGKHGRSTAITVIFAMTLIGVVSGVVALVIKGFINWFNEKKLKEALKEKNHEMEMALIKSKIDPHLLFNTINNIDSLIIKDAVEASNYLNKLSDIMRFMLYETMAEKILLSQEIEYIEKYIALQKIRTANVNYIHFTVSGDIGNKYIAPMIFIPFIENAFKHTTNKKLENAISVNILITDKKIKMVCENKFDSKPKIQPMNSGLGNELIQKRLQLIYADKHLLEINKNNELYSVHLTINNG